MHNYGSHSAASFEAIETPGVVNIFLVVAVALALFTANPLLTIVAVCVLPLLARLTWLRSEPPILFFAVSIQWLQVSTAVFYANLQGRVLGSSPDPHEMEQAFWLAMIGLVVLAVGMRMAAGRNWGGIRADYQEIDIQKYSISKIWRIYLALFVMANILTEYLWHFMPLRSISLALLALRWVAYFSLVYVSMVAGKGIRQPVLLIAIVLEVVLGFAGFFSGYRTPLMIFLIAFLASKARLSNRDMLPAIAIIAIIVFLSVIWTAIKPEYRRFLNQGTHQQVVSVSLSNSLLKASNLALEIKGVDVGIAAEQLLSRIAYIKYFAYAIDYVPRVKEHELGGLWFAAFKHIAMPRLLFTDKAELQSDSELTMQYTGLRMASAKQGTSISMGYMAESYIDFGVPLMFVPIFLLGCLWGGMYRYFIATTTIQFMGYGFAMIVLMGAAQLEIHAVKLLGGVLTNFIVFALFNHFYLRRFAHKLLVNE